MEYFLSHHSPPVIVFEHVARQLGVEFGPAFVHPDRTLYRHRPAVLKRLGVTAWGTALLGGTPGMRSALLRATAMRMLAAFFPASLALSGSFAKLPDPPR